MQTKQQRSYTHRRSQGGRRLVLPGRGNPRELGVLLPAQGSPGMSPLHRTGAHLSGSSICVASQGRSHASCSVTDGVNTLMQQACFYCCHPPPRWFRESTSQPVPCSSCIQFLSKRTRPNATQPLVAGIIASQAYGCSYHGSLRNFLPEHWWK